MEIVDNGALSHKIGVGALPTSSILRSSHYLNNALSLRLTVIVNGLYQHSPAVTIAPFNAVYMARR